MPNWILCPVRNGIEYTRPALRCFFDQNVGDVKVLIIDNASDDGTAEWLEDELLGHGERSLNFIRNNPAKSVAASWNQGLKHIFDARNATHCLVVNNDVLLRPDTYLWLLAANSLFITAGGSQDPKEVEPKPKLLGYDAIRKKEVYWLDADGNRIVYHHPPDLDAARSHHPDFSCFLIKRDVFRKVGDFDERFGIAYGEDCDYHVRMHRAGVRAEKLPDLPFLHYASGTKRSFAGVDSTKITEIDVQAERNREYFRNKYGVKIGTPEYYALFKDEFFGIDAKERPE